MGLEGEGGGGGGGSRNQLALAIVVVGWLLDVSATSQYISRADLLRRLYMLPH